MKTRIFSFFLAAVFCLLAFSGCRKKNQADEGTPNLPDAPVTTGQVDVIYDEKFGNTYIPLTIEAFNALGFAFGDSIKIEFDNGKTYEDVPYFSGYYVPIGEMLVVGHRDNLYVMIARNYQPTWEEFEVTEGSSKVVVTREEKAKYLAREELYSLDYSDYRTDFESDVMFANSREVKGGNLKEGTFYRSASPCDNQHNRAPYANDLAKESGIRAALNLSDNETSYQSHVEAEDFKSDYYHSLYENGDVLLCALKANYRSQEFAEILSQGILEMIRKEGPYLIHCVEGKDRTGFACALLLALAGASAKEIIDDYMITYENYYGVTKEGMPQRYEAVKINVDDFISCFHDISFSSFVSGNLMQTLDLKTGAENYLRHGGLTDAEIDEIEAAICK